MKHWLLTFISNLLSSCLISIILFVAVFSVVTGEFPPKIGHLKQAFESLTELSALHTDFNNSTPETSDDESVSHLAQLKKKQQQIAQKIFGNLKNQVKTEVEDSLQNRLLENERRISLLQNKIEQLTLEIEILKKR